MDRITFAKTSGTVTRDKGTDWPIAERRMPSGAPRNNFETHIGYSCFLVSKVANEPQQEVSFGLLRDMSSSKRYLLSMSKNVRDTIRFVPQLSMVAMEKALPLMPAGKISLNRSQDTVKQHNIIGYLKVARHSGSVLFITGYMRLFWGRHRFVYWLQ